MAEREKLDSIQVSRKLDARNEGLESVKKDSVCLTFSTILHRKISSRYKNVSNVLEMVMVVQIRCFFEILRCNNVDPLRGKDGQTREYEGIPHGKVSQGVRR